MSNDDQDAKKRIVVVTVHGTGDTATTPDGEKWFQNGSDFVVRLKQRLGTHLIDATIVPFLWSGANSAIARESGSHALARLLKRLAKAHSDVHIVGHSHGGNVANDAAAILGWSQKQRRAKLASITTVGAPFFRAHVTRGERWGAWAFIGILVMSVVVATGIIFIAQWWDAQWSPNTFEPCVQSPQDAGCSDRAREHDYGIESEGQSQAFIARLVALGVVSFFLMLVFVFPTALRGVRRILRVSRNRSSDATVFSIWHPNDEAIAFLQHVEHLPIEPFPRWSLLRGSRTGGVVWGARVAIAIPALGLVASLISFAWTAFAGELPDSVNDLAWLAASALVLGIAGAPLVFAVVYLFYRAIIAMVFEFLLRGWLNHSVGGSLNGMAFGRDGDIRIGDVATCSHHFATHRVVLEGEVAQRMLDNATAATRRLFDKYRGGLFSVDTAQNNAVSELATDAMTWESLIHTTYFDQPEIADMIGDYIADEM